MFLIPGGFKRVHSLEPSLHLHPLVLRKSKRRKGEGEGSSCCCQGKRKVEVADKEKCFQCNMNEHWIRNCTKYLAEKKKENKDDSDIYCVKETSSIQQLEEDEMKTKTGTGDIISAHARGEVVIPDDGIEDQLSCKQPMNDIDKYHWVKVMDLAMESMYFNSVWELVDLPKGVKPIGCKWIYKRTRDSAGKPEGFITQGQEQNVCNLNQSIYGLKQASKSWNIRFDTTIKSYGFDQNFDEPCVYKKINKGMGFTCLGQTFVMQWE
ncbi:gag/pol protein [Cucumis melo var. makuwa]|uniref:Gag/pol protein n=1 Tax=Cucumis melo var. makuwa TaxID=1194695 RepID=A0A5D3C040_CUCMM|nr:gag/pol protein [Cucumis melo var. makuwa]